MIARLAAAALVCSAAALGAIPALAQPTAPPPEPGRISIVGRALVEAPPDYASVQIAVATKAATASAALGENSAAAAKVIALAKAQGVEAAHIGTGAVVLSPAYRNVRSPSGQTEQQPDGYQASNAVTIRLADMGKLGDLMRQAVDQGANRIDSVSFGVNDMGKLEREAAVAATRDALERGRAVAAAAGAALGPIDTIASPARSERPNVPFREMRAVAAAPARGVPIEAGTIQVAADVEIVWLLRQP